MDTDPEVASLLALKIWISTSPLYLTVTCPGLVSWRLLNEFQARILRSILSWSAMRACECDKAVIWRWRQAGVGAHHTGDEPMSISLSDCRCIVMFCGSTHPSR